VIRARTLLEIVGLAFRRFVMHDAWAIASHIALSFLTSLFPFLILLAASPACSGPSRWPTRPAG